MDDSAEWMTGGAAALVAVLWPWAAGPRATTVPSLVLADYVRGRDSVVRLDRDRKRGSWVQWMASGSAAHMAIL